MARDAVAVLARLGLGTPMSRLADELGVKRPTLHYHFPSRAHIVEAALEELLTEQALFVMERVNQHEHPIDRLFAQLSAVHAFHHGREGRIAFLSQAIAASGERVTEIIDVGNRVFEAQRQAAVELLEQGMADGTVEACDAQALISVIRALTDGLVAQRVMTDLDLTPVHEFIWTHLLSPLKRTRKKKS
ncbi:MAG: helix-turn-helix transcriptional regulator [Myxococcales bacterium]|nr:helix-turn-helix transcriptional regulator [Myxococcales bacterium]